ncbi:hypothetical protein BHE74_00016664 [Ensete ventricosum]|nr:hypothetical protein GW17_00058281 [Ensete ventricosum]RWW75318.1 hypothetical protein BHE74_00016664 [Ensete ventricosum]
MGKSYEGTSVVGRRGPTATVEELEVALFLVVDGVQGDSTAIVEQEQVMTMIGEGQRATVSGQGLATVDGSSIDGGNSWGRGAMTTMKRRAVARIWRAMAIANGL